MPAAAVRTIALAAALLLGACADRPDACVPGSVTLPLLGHGGDSPIVAVQVHDRPAAMFFSPGFGPILLRNNGTLRFPTYHIVELRQQDNDSGNADASFAGGLAVGALRITDRHAIRLKDDEDRAVAGLPIVGMLGRGILPDKALVVLDMPARKATVTTRCTDTPDATRPGAVPMGEIVLLVPVSINGRTVQAILDPDLPTSILPASMAADLGIDPASLGADPSVVTRFGRSVLGRRHRVASFGIGAVTETGVAFDVERDVRYPIIGLNVLARGRSMFDFRNSRFLFQPTLNDAPPATSLHFDRTRVAHVAVAE